MKKVTLTPKFTEKSNRLKTPVQHLYYRGLALEEYGDTPMVAVVGTRKPTPYGKAVTETIVEELCNAGVIIVSGLAIGIDALAHSTAVAAGGRTIAVLPSGLATIYPATHAPLAKQILDKGGTLLSEYGEIHKPRKVEFLERNRIIASLADAVLIPEAAANSGSLNTANHARQVGTPICTVPGPITSPMSVGTNHLLKTGAYAVNEAADILKLLRIPASNMQTALDLIGETPEETLILQKIALGHTTFEELAAETKLDITTFQTTVSMLEVQGRIASDELGNWRIKR
jgi:DNA processing protein